jgi:hypothetical protein
MTVSTRRRLPVSQGGGRCRERLLPAAGPAASLLGRAAARPAVAAVVAVGQGPAGHLGQQLFTNGQVGEVGRGQPAVHDHPGPAHPEMGAQAKIGLLGHLVVAQAASSRSRRQR